ncbi:hypothetical protein M422DRAFT_252160 [Sphaerobolus stellatus SS14]|uniref:Uncharacterized protein n=1 Tax=Sphaerobolus stellatus (strain SS14) TaxID=990650 RepID=A0A0C9VZL7_SPHS4|nr:hypothetical protein M422DRAFT_252160 [Sphaerobolus stellatus SS14]
MSKTNSKKTTSTSCRHVPNLETNMWCEVPSMRKPALAGSRQTRAVDADTETTILPEDTPQDTAPVQPMRESGTEADEGACAICIDRGHMCICSQCHAKICYAETLTQPGCMKPEIGEAYKEDPEHWLCVKCRRNANMDWPWIDGRWSKELPCPRFDIDTHPVLTIIFTLEETPTEAKMNPIISIMQSTLEAIPMMLDPTKKVIHNGLLVNLVLDTHVNIHKGYVCIKPARGKTKAVASTLHDWLEGFLGEKVLKAFADPRCTVIILMSTCGPLMLTGSQCEECYGLMINLVPAMIATTMARVLQLISSFKMSPKDAIEEACAQRLLGMYTRVILMTLVPMPGHNNFKVNDIMFSYAAGTVRVHGLSNPICIHCGSNTKEEQHQKKWYFKCLFCKRKTNAVECPEDVTGAVRRDLTDWVWVQGRRPSWDHYPDIWVTDKKEAIPLKNKGKEREATGTSGIPSSLPKVAGETDSQTD